jgi:hypothetical protein
MLVAGIAPREASGSPRSCPGEPDDDEDEDSDWRSAL